MPTACTRNVDSVLPVVYVYKCVYANAARSPHAPRTVKGLTEVRWHGVGLSWKLSCSLKRLVLQETCLPCAQDKDLGLLPVMHIRYPPLVRRTHLGWPKA